MAQTKVKTGLIDSPLGIGTDSPLSQLHVDFTADLDGLRIQNSNRGHNYLLTTAQTNAEHFSIYDVDNSANLMQIGYAQARIYTNNTERMRIDSSGNVGIGTTSPTEAKLVVEGTSEVIAAFGRDGTDGDVVQVYNGLAGTTKVLAFGASGSDGTIYSQYGDIILQETAGNVGIGTDSPLSKLHIQNTSANDGIRIINSTSGEGYIVFGDTADSNTGSIAYNHTSDAMTFDVNNAERMRIDSSGNIGVGGSASDGYRLQVLGTSQDSTTISMTYVGVAAGALKMTSNGAMAFGVDTADGSTERMRIDSSGNVGIGVVPKSSISSTWQHIQFGGTGSIIARHSDAQIDSMFSNNYYIDGSNVDKRIATGEVANLFLDNDQFIFRNAASGAADSTISFTERMRIYGNGEIAFKNSLGSDALFWNNTYSRLGIGTTSPDAVIHANVSTAGANIAKFSDPNNRALIIEASTEGMKIITTEESDETDSDRALIFQRGNVETMRIDSSGNVGIGTDSPSVSLHINDTDAVKMPSGTTAQRPTGIAGMLRYNTTDGQFEGYTNAWGALGGGGGGAATDLSDYEEGTWTPALDTSNSSIGNGSISVTSANYTKIGNIVSFDCKISIASVQYNSPDDNANLYLSGLPFSTSSEASVSFKADAATQYGNSGRTGAKVKGSKIESQGWRIRTGHVYYFAGTYFTSS